MRALTGWLSQVVVVSLLNLRTITQRLSSSAVAVVGIAGVVAVFVSVLSMGEGFRRTMATTGSPDTAIVMRSGADSEMVSILGREDVRIIGDAPGVRRGGDGPFASAELFVIVDLLKRSSNTTANVPLRGVGAQAFRVRPNVKIVEGRMFQAGRNELIVGRGANTQFVGTDVGRTLRWGQNEWKVVGVFDAGGTFSDSEIWCDATVLQPAYRRGNSFQTVYAKLESPAAFTRFKDALTTDPRLNLKVVRETDYFEEQSQMVSTLITTLGSLIAFLMGIGAIFGAVNTMYSAVAARTREIATLRALGFGGGPVVVSVMVESLLLAIVGGAIGGAIAYFGFNGFRTSTINWQTFSQVAFAFTVTPGLVIAGIVYAVVMGLLGGLLPAVRAARLPIVSALREL
ncbi:MAG: ABC transporter permease [Acidobacteria bacterium]|nr:ABC transporter permease [Acidobacteriota bacterium]